MLTDVQLIDAINVGGDAGAAAFEILYRRYRDWVLAVAWRHTHDRDLSLDVLQDTFLYVLGKFPGFTLTCQFRTFLYPVIRHIAVTAQHKARRMRADPGAAALAAATPADPAGADPDGHDDLAAVLAQLPPGQREVLLLRFVDDLPLHEIATALGVPLGTVKSRLHQALATLRADPRTRPHLAP
ncbi:MAG: sigma-70 family RNA polymerase sigma factor [Phycisphaeraceae bacterium]